MRENGQAKCPNRSDRGDRSWPVPPIIKPPVQRRDLTRLSGRAPIRSTGTFSNACHVAIVEVDIETGRVDPKFLAVEDAAACVDPLIADGQVHSGIASIGSTLFQEIVYDERYRDRDAGRLHPPAHRSSPIDPPASRSPAASSITSAKGWAKAAPSAPGRHPQRHQRCTIAVQHVDERVPGDAGGNFPSPPCGGKEMQAVLDAEDWRNADKRYHQL